MKTKAKEEKRFIGGIVIASIILAISLFAVFPMAISSEQASSNPDADIYVNTTGWWRPGAPFNESTNPIQAAINNASDGNTIFVYNGTYRTNIHFDKPITLKGEGPDKVVLDGNGDIRTIKIDEYTSNCIVEGFNITNSTIGISVRGPNCVIRDNIIKSKGNTMENTIYIGAQNTTVMGNVMDGGFHTLGSIHIDVPKCTFINNVVTNCTGDYGALYIMNTSHSNIIANNSIINNKGAGIITQSAGVVGGGNNTITRNNIKSNKLAGILLYEKPASGNKIYLNNIIDNGVTATTFGSTPPEVTYWNSTESIEYVYNGTTYTNYLGNNWSDYTNGDANGDGIGDTSYTVPDSLGYDFRPLMAGYENYFKPAAAEPPHLVTYTISNRTITPPQTTEIDVEFSETVSYKIAIEKDTATIYDWTGTAKNPDPKIWNGTYEANGSVVPDGDYTVNVTGTNTTTGLSVVNSTEVITVMSITEQPDLIVTAINAYHNNTGCAAWFNLSNEIDVTVKNNGTTAAGASNVSLYIDSMFFGTLPVSSLAAGANETVTFEDWIPIGDDCQQPPCIFNWSYRNYSITAIADCDNDVAESNETNNETSVVDRACYNGYMADEPLENVAHGTLHGQLIYTTGNGTYGGLYSVGASRATGYDITLPSGASVELAHLNVYYTWHYEKESCPQMEVSITNATGTYVLPLEKAYNDIKCTCPGAAWVFPWGNYVYDLTDYIAGSGTYTVTVKRTGGPSFCIAAPGIVLLYEDENAPLIEYWINNGADVLIGGRRSDGGYLAWWECMNNATFEGSINLSEVKNATLGVVAPWAGSSWQPGMTNYLFFNDVELGTGVYHGFGETYDRTIDSISMHIGSTNAQVGVNLTDVTSYLNANINIAGQADDGDNMMPANAFLVVEYKEEAAPVIPWVGYLVPQNSTGSYGEDTAVELRVTYNDTGLTHGAIAYQVDVHFDPGCVNVTAANFSTSPFAAHMFTPYAPGVVRILEDNLGTMTPISSGTYKMATLTLHGESTSLCSCNLWFDNNLVSDTDGEPITNTYTDGTYTCAGVAEPDLIVTGITQNCGYLFANESNEISATIKNNGTADAGAFNVSFSMDGVSKQVAVSGLAAGNSTTISVTDPTQRNAGDSVTITMTADCNGAIDESNETNNASALTASVMNSGYKGKRYTGGEDIKTVQTDRLNGNLLYSVGDSKYLSGSATAWYTYTANWTASNLPVPGDASIEKARLYVMYTWDKVQGMPDNVSMKFNNNPKTRDAFYTDRKGFGSSNYPYGMLVYNVTADFNRSGNTAVLENLNPVAGNPSMRGMLLIVVYANESEPERTILVNEEFDLLYGGSAQCTTPAEATAYAPFGALDLTGVEKATLITVAPGAGPDEGELIFNGHTWNDVWNYAGSSQIGINETDVTSYLNATENEAGFQSSADYMEASNAFLVLELAPAPKPPYLVTYTISNRTIIPPQTTSIDVEFSEEVSWTIAIQKDATTVYDWAGISTNPTPKVWNGTYEVNGTRVPDGNYRVNVTGINTTTGLSVVNNTETITVISAKVAPEIISFAPSSPVTDTEGATRIFNITVNQIVNVSWQINGTEIQTNESVTEASYTNYSAAIGTWNVSAIVENANGTDMQTWMWNVTPYVPPAPNIIDYAPESPVNDTICDSRTFNVTVNQAVNVSWYQNESLLFTNESVTEANCTLHAEVVGEHNVSAVASNPNGTDMQTWIWNVTKKPLGPTADSLGVEDATGRSGTYVVVPVNITNVRNGPVLGIGFEIAYNKSVINVTKVSKGNLVSNWSEPNVNNNFTWGTRVTIAGSYAADAIPDGSSGSVVLLNFSVIGSPGETSSMNVTLIELSNLTGGVGTAPTRNATFTVSKLGSIAGRITYACNGTGIAGVVVNLTKEGAVLNTTVTNETGYYNFTNLIPNSYFVNASKLRFWDNSTEVTVIAGETASADMTLWLKGDLNNDGKSADIGDLVLMNRASVGEIAGDWRYDLNKNGIIADIGDLVLMNRASVKEIELL